ncbi:MAG: bifunctional metallophosphatase/5'-nucleotidase [Clostridia bacterium]|nr:bifunctional metallophosphatase/5'-nucleotidase [Clostridia bacterium]
MRSKYMKIGLMVSLLCMLLCVCVFAQTPDQTQELTVLFTHDLHSHLLPAATETGDGEYGGYARLMTAIHAEKEKAPDAVLLDGGDFAMGSLFQTAYPTSAIELRMMGAMGYDVTTFGNHEFDYLQSGLKSMMRAALDSGDPLPALVCANYLPPVEGQDGYDPELWQVYNDYGVRDYIILERGGVYYVVFGIFGFDADDCAPNSGMVFEDPITVAAETVKAAVADCEAQYGQHPVVICLSHSGTSGGQGEDYALAQAVEGIDVIISGHTHTKLTEPIRVNGTLIVSADEYGKNLGVLKLTQDGEGVSLVDYELIPIDETVADDPEIAALTDKYKKTVEDEYLSNYGVTFDQVLVRNPYAFETDDEVSSHQHESPLCNIYSDAYKWAVEKTTGKTVDVAITAAGVVRGSLPTGDVTVSDTFNAASLGVGTEGELIGIYLTGKDLKNAIELDASIQPLMSTAQLFMSGAEYSFNQYRMIFNKVDYAMLRGDDGTLSEIDDEQLYFVVAGMYMGQMLGSVEETSMGLLSITPRDEAGNPIAVDELVNYVVRDENGTPLKEWYAIADYLLSMGGEMDARYASTDGRKVVYASLNPVKLLRNANVFTYVVLLVIAVLIAVIVCVVRLIVRRRRRKAAVR